MRLAVYTDYVYRRVGETVFAERAFALFLDALGDHMDRLLLIGRLAPEGDLRYRLRPEIGLAPLPYYASLTNPSAALGSLARSLRAMWSALEDVDTVWVLGPYPHSVALVLVALLRRRRVVLGLRQEMRSYVRMRRPGRRWMHAAADILELIWRLLAFGLPVVAVGPQLSAQYAHAPAVLDLTVSLVPERVLEAPRPPRDYGSELRVLSVGRLDDEKNPLLLADILARLRRDDPHWKLLICGDGDRAPAVAQRLRELGVSEAAELLGYVPMGEQLIGRYRSSHAMLHVSLTEGFPQVLIEAFATGLPVVATAVGGIPSGVGDAALLVPPGDAEAAACALERVATDPRLRQELVAAGLTRARGLTLEAQTERLAAFLRAQSAGGRRRLRPPGRGRRAGARRRGG